MKAYSTTDTGIMREMNQDYLFMSEKEVGNLPNLFIVADGMGGHKAGDYASRFSVNRVVASITRNKGDEPIPILKEAIETANELLVQESSEDEDKAGMGTTMVVAVICDEILYVANVGDSRLYVLNKDIKQITKDHSLVNEMVRMGEINESEARNHPDKNIITRAIGATDEIDVDFFEVNISKGDIILLCTDGLTNMVGDEEILETVKKMDNALVVPELIKMANANGGRDNITAMIIKPFSDEVK